MRTLGIAGGRSYRRCVGATPTRPLPATTIPRWEWRAFGDDLAGAEGHLSGLGPARTEESDELYLLSPYSDASVKVRDGLMDVKHRLHVDRDGLEQWTPVLKAPFPLEPGAADLVLTTLGGSERSGSEELPDLDALLTALPDVVPVRVHKRRRRHSVGGCMAEVSDFDTAAGVAWTVAVESEDPARVAAAVHSLGLEDRRVECVARGLRSLVGVHEPRRAVIDVGTNSVKFAVAERGDDGAPRRVVDRAEVTRLGEGLDADGRLQRVPIERTVDAVASMVEEAQRLGAEGIEAVGTAALRIARNSDEFVDAVRSRCGVEIRIIPAEEEGRLAYVAARSVLGAARGAVVVFDTGGGSSQFTFGRGDEVEDRFSVNVGAARFTERFGLDGPVSTRVLAEARAAIALDLERLRGRAAPDAVVAMGGASTNLAAVERGLVTYDPDVVHGTVLDVAAIDRQIERYRTQTAAERRETVGLQPARAEVILAGATIVRTVLDLLGSDSLTVSDRGLRHGLLAERLAAASPAPDGVPD